MRARDVLSGDKIPPAVAALGVAPVSDRRPASRRLALRAAIACAGCEIPRLGDGVPFGQRPRVLPDDVLEVRLLRLEAAQERELAAGAI